jgi:hypothetical protein
MRISKQRIKQIIKEELSRALNETTDVDGDGDTDPQDVLAVAKAMADDVTKAFGGPEGAGPLQDWDDEDDFNLGPKEENQELVVVAFDALDEALEAVKALEPPFKFNRDSPITAADVDNKIHYINRSWRKIQGE